jgi:probable HAF family extracellular repeat protein
MLNSSALAYERRLMHGRNHATIRVVPLAAAILALFVTVVGLASTVKYRFSSAGEFPGAWETLPEAASLTHIVGYYNVSPGGQFGYVQARLQNSHLPFLNLQPPGDWFSFAAGVNNRGVVVGGSCVPPQQCNYPQTTNGFSYSNGTYTTIDYPGSMSTGAYGINDSGQVVGGYCLTVPVCGSTLGVTDHGFLDSNGTFSSIDYPGAQATQAYAINNMGTIVGTYEVNNDQGHSFLYQSGQYENIDFPGAALTHASAINNKGVVAGYYELPSTQVLGFVYSAGHFESVNYPPSHGTSVTGINYNGVLVGVWAPAEGHVIAFKAIPVR